jgi:hypothetical protein
MPIGTEATAAPSLLQLRSSQANSYATRPTHNDLTITPPLFPEEQGAPKMAEIKLQHFSEEDINLLRMVVQRERQRRVTPSNNEVPSPPTQAPEVYLAQPVTDIVGLSDPESTTGTGTGTGNISGFASISSGYCNIYRIATWEGSPTSLSYVPIARKLVYNIGSATIEAGALVVIERDKFGQWFASSHRDTTSPVSGPSFNDCSDSTGTGTNPDGLSDVHCEGDGNDIEAIRDVYCVDGIQYVERGKLQGVIDPTNKFRLDWYDLVIKQEGCCECSSTNTTGTGTADFPQQECCTSTYETSVPVLVTGPFGTSCLNSVLLGTATYTKWPSRKLSREPFGAVATIRV